MAVEYDTFEALDNALGFTAKCGFTLKPLQITDIETFAGWDVSLNRYEVGGGKTVIATAVSLMRGHDLTIVTVPPILIAPWVRWLEKFGMKVVRYQGTPKDRRLLAKEFNDARWIVCSHAIFRDDFDELYGASLGTRFGLIVDEAHFAKNSKSVLFKRIVAISSGKDCQLLTGTPTSKPVDAYAYIKLKTPTVYRSLTHFENMHVAERDFFKQPIAWEGLDLVRQHLDVQTISRTKLEVHGYDNAPLFPDTTYSLSPEHYRLYTKLVDEQLLMFDDGSKIDATTAQKLYHALQQVIVNYDHFSNDPDARSTAFDLIDSVIDQTECATVSPDKSKLIIWTHYKRTSARVLEYVTKLGIKAVAAYSGANSQKSFDLFMTDPETRIGVFQYQSAGAGLNPQSVCWEALFLELNTTPLQNVQAAGRLDRVGQMHKPTMRYAVAEGTIQHKLLKNLLDKDDLVQKVESNRNSLRKALLGLA